MKRGQHYWVPAFAHEIRVTRVSREGSWADIVVRAGHSTWRKRQPLRDGIFPFEAEVIS